MAIARGMELFASQSYAKNLGLYGDAPLQPVVLLSRQPNCGGGGLFGGCKTIAERIGALNIVCRDAATADAVKSQLKTIIRPMYSNPPLHGARLVSKILSDKSLYNEWYRACACVRVCGVTEHCRPTGLWSSRRCRTASSA